MDDTNVGTALQRLAAVPAKAGRTIIAYALDESGSMAACQDAVRSGFAEFLATLRRTPGAEEAVFFLVKVNPAVVPVPGGCPWPRSPTPCAVRSGDRRMAQSTASWTASQARQSDHFSEDEAQPPRS